MCEVEKVFIRAFVVGVEWGGPLPAPRPAGAGLWRVPPPQAGEGWDISACGLLGFASRKGKMKVE